MKGPELDLRLLAMPREWLRQHDLELDLALGRHFDLALSLEVAEHLSWERGPSFVQWLTQLADFVLFSAAIPGQGGSGHRGERWQGDWIGFFEQHNYQVFDLIRPRI